MSPQSKQPVSPSGSALQ
jgi:hypothetical protein